MLLNGNNYYGKWKGAEINKYLIQMDMIAANYATTLNLHQMSHLTNPDYCNNLTIISSDNIAKNLFFNKDAK